MSMFHSVPGVPRAKTERQVSFSRHVWCYQKCYKTPVFVGLTYELTYTVGDRLANAFSTNLNLFRFVQF